MNKSRHIVEIGAKASIRKAFTQGEVIQFAELSLDRNPLHLDQDFARASIFGQRIVHGMLVASLFSGLIGMTLPGQGSIYLGQTLTFKAPVFIGQEVTATVEIVKIRHDKPIATLSTVCENDNGQVVVTGEAVVKMPHMAPAS